MERYLKILRHRAEAVFAAKLLSVFLGFLVSYMTVNFYGSETLGLLALSTFFSTLIMLVATFGAKSSSIHFATQAVVAKSFEQLSRTINLILFATLALTVAISIFLVCFSSFFAELVLGGSANYGYVELIALFAVFRSAGEVLTAVTRVTASALSFAILVLSPTFFQVAFTILAIILDLDLHWIIIAYLASSISILPIAFFINLKKLFVLRKSLDRRPSHRLSLYNFFNFSSPFAFSEILAYFFPQVGLIASVYLLDKSFAGYYSIALKLSILPSFVVFSFNSVSAPRISALYNSGRISELKDYVRSANKKGFFYSVALILLIALTSSFFVEIAFGVEYLVSVPSTLVLLVAQFVRSLSGSSDPLMHMTGGQRSLRNILMFSFFFSTAAMFALTPIIGFIGISVSYLGGVLLWKVLSVIHLYRRFGFIM